MSTHDSHWSTIIDCVVVVGESFTPASFEVTFNLDVQTESTYKQVMGHERLAFLMNSLVNNCVIVDRNSPHAEYLHENTASTVMDCWADPHDQFIGVLLYYKATAIMEGHIKINALSIKNHGGRSVFDFTFYGEDLEEARPFEDVNWAEMLSAVNKTRPWYQRPDTTLNDYIMIDEDEGDVPYIWDNGMSWDDLMLNWDEQTEPTTGVVVPITKFKPTIVP